MNVRLKLVLAQFKCSSFNGQVGAARLSTADIELLYGAGVTEAAATSDLPHHLMKGS